MRPELKTKRYFTCPNGCASEFTVEHLFSGPCAVTKDYPTRTAGPWYCGDCGHGWRLTYDANGVEVEPHTEKRVSQWVILELPPQTEPVRFKVKGSRYKSEIDEDGARYFYEEHTCPTNWLRDVDEVSIGDDDDPHGLWRVVSVYDADAVASEDALQIAPPPQSTDATPTK